MVKEVILQAQGKARQVRRECSQDYEIQIASWARWKASRLLLQHMKQISYIKKAERFVHILENSKKYENCFRKLIIFLKLKKLFWQTVEVLKNKSSDNKLANGEIVISQEPFFLPLLCSCSLSCYLQGGITVTQCTSFL